MSDTDMAYLARCPRGHFVGVTVDMPEHRAAVARDVARWVRGGNTVERMTVAEARPFIEWSDEHRNECLKKPSASKRGALL